ncbi:hypothetical protein DPMN_137354 [Dreissena polymorpha]|uniref:Uncharacterized protein n=1 Tax=Dreissena polymorpha TaxID=45954 RepID=A0A9D4G2L4_DREPO|nr:hypothetical protein DPMN_137354 [Dreissena polymorpha]
MTSVFGLWTHFATQQATVGAETLAVNTTTPLSDTLESVAVRRDTHLPPQTLSLVRKCWIPFVPTSVIVEMRATFHTSIIILSCGILYRTTYLHIGRTTATWKIFVNVHRDINGP